MAADIMAGAVHTPLQAICLAGPTASGKSSLAMALAERLPLEIISVDSALVYRGMDIGTAKPTPAEQATVPHHLIDVCDPSETYSAAEFASDARALIGQIRQRGRMPLLVGGTMLYFKALFEGLDDLPPADPAIRHQIEALAAERGWPALHLELARVDPATAARLAPRDSQRIQRALEVWKLTGQPLSSFHTRRDESASAAWASAAFFSLEPDDRAWLHERIARRFDEMLEACFLDEVRALQQRGDLIPDLPAMRSVGYRQAWQALAEDWPPAQLRERAVAATRQLAKRQLTWLRSMPGRHRLVADAGTGREQMLDEILAVVRQGQA